MKNEASYSFPSFSCYFCLFLGFFSVVWLLYVNISVSVLRPLDENPAMFMPPLLTSSRLSLVPRLYPLPCWEHSSVSSTTKGERWWAVSLLLVVLKGTPVTLFCRWCRQLHPAGTTEGTTLQTKQKHARTLGKNRNTHNYKESRMGTCIFITHWSSRSFCSWGRNL